jgi:hypothetical protein
VGFKPLLVDAYSWPTWALFGNFCTPKWIWLFDYLIIWLFNYLIIWLFGILNEKWLKRRDVPTKLPSGLALPCMSVTSGRRNEGAVGFRAKAGPSDFERKWGSARSSLLGITSGNQVNDTASRSIFVWDKDPICLKASFVCNPVLVSECRGSQSVISGHIMDGSVWIG